MYYCNMFSDRSVWQQFWPTNLQTLQKIFHIYWGDCSYADWINRISMCQSQTLSSIRRIDTGYRHLPSSQGCMFTMWLSLKHLQRAGTVKQINTSLPRKYTPSLICAIYTACINNFTTLMRWYTSHLTTQIKHFIHTVSTLVSMVLAVLHFKHHLRPCTHT